MQNGEKVTRRGIQPDRPIWTYQDSVGVQRTGYFEKSLDHGGTDITYFFRRVEDGQLDLVSGLRLRAAKRIWKGEPPCQKT